MPNQSILKCGLPWLAAITLFAATPAVAEVNRIVLRVNDRIATLYDYQQLKDERLRMLARSGLSEEEQQRERAKLGVETMRNLFQEMLLLSRADQLDVRVAPSRLQEALESTKESFGIQTDEEYEAALRASGLTREGLREQIEDSLRIREVFGLEVYSEVRVEEEDLRRYYSAHPEEFRTTAALLLREVIVLEASGSREEELAALAQELRAAIVAGEGDQLLAETQADGRTTGWIDLGWVEEGDLDRQLEEAIEGLEVKAVSEPTPARGGLHLLQILERRDSRLQDFGEIRDQLEQAERGRRIEKRQVEYLRDLEEQAFIVSNPPPDAAEFRADLTAVEPTAVESVLGVEGAPGADPSIP